MRGLSVRRINAPVHSGVFPPCAGVIGYFFGRRHEHKVFPPCAGVIGSSRMHYLCMTRIPPVCGGYRSNVSGLYGWNVYSPRVRGLSVTFWQLVKHFCVFPPHAGVIGGALNRHPLAGSIPPACGGYRHYQI